MNKIVIGKTLRTRRKLVGLSVKDTCVRLAEKGITVSEKTIYGWENGYSQPDADILMILCTIYGIDDILATFGYMGAQQPAPIALSPQEHQLIVKFREHEDMQRAVCALLNLK